MLVKEARRVILNLIAEVGNGGVSREEGLFLGMRLGGLFLEFDRRMRGAGYEALHTDRVQPVRSAIAIALGEIRTSLVPIHTNVRELCSHIVQLMVAIEKTGEVPKEWDITSDRWPTPECDFQAEDETEERAP